MVIINTRTDEVSIQAVSPESIFGGGVAAAGVAAAGAGVAAVVVAGAAALVAVAGVLAVWADAASGAPAIMVASANPASRGNIPVFIFVAFLIG